VRASGWRLKALLKRRSFDHDLDDELAFHLAMREEKHASAGVLGSETPFLTRRQFGNAARIKEACREMRPSLPLNLFGKTYATVCARCAGLLASR
jgi:hypothetical protein